MARKIRRSRSGDADLNITSLMDIFTILLVFLLQNYSVTEVKLTPPKGVSLPPSSAQIEPEVLPDITISKDSISFDNTPILTLVGGVVEERYYDQNKTIEPLLKAIREKLATQEYIQQLREKSGATAAPATPEVVDDDGETPEQPGHQILLLAHKEHSFKLIEDVMFTAAAAGISKFKFAVMKND